MIAGDGDGLFTFLGAETLSFDYWVDSQAGSVNLQFWNATRKISHQSDVPKLVPGKWTHVTLRAAEVGDPGDRLKEGDVVGSLYLQGTGPGVRKFYVDNIVLTRPRSIRPRPINSK